MEAVKGVKIYCCGFVSGGAGVCVSEERSVLVCMGGVGGVSRWSHLSADGSGVGVEIRRPASQGFPQHGASDVGQRHRQRLVLVVCGHVGNALASIAHLISSTDVERRVIGRAGGAVSALPPCGFGGIGGSRWLRWRHRQWADNRAVQAGYTAGIAGKVLLRDGATVRPILLAAVVLQRESSPLHVQ